MNIVQAIRETLDIREVAVFRDSDESSQSAKPDVLDQKVSVTCINYT